MVPRVFVTIHVSGLGQHQTLKVSALTPLAAIKHAVSETIDVVSAALSVKIHDQECHVLDDQYVMSLEDESQLVVDATKR